MICDMIEGNKRIGAIGMKSISIDFKNDRICIMSAGQQGVEHSLFRKEDFLSFIPEKWHAFNSFTWNFEDEVFAVNQEYELVDGAIMTSDCFIPILMIPMPGLADQYDNFLSLMDYEEVNLIEEMPEELRKLLGLD